MEIFEKSGNGKKNLTKKKKKKRKKRKSKKKMESAEMKKIFKGFFFVNTPNSIIRTMY